MKNSNKNLFIEVEKKYPISIQSEALKQQILKIYN